MRVLSLFDGISAGQVALQRAGIEVSTYYASEVDSYAIGITQKNFPNTTQLGDVRNLDVSALGHIDLLIGGSPCFDVSVAGKQAGIKAKTLGEYLELKAQGHEFVGQSFLFWEYVRIKRDLEALNPNLKFLLENVPMKPKFLEQFNETMGIKPTPIDSKLVSAQSRQRLYWSNLGDRLPQPLDRGMAVANILDEDAADKLIVRNTNYYETSTRSSSGSIRIGGISTQTDLTEVKAFGQGQRVYSVEGKSVTLKANGGGQGAKTGLYKIDLPDGSFHIRRLSVTECERLQTFIEGYSSGVSDSQRYKCLGNSWTVDVIVHILKHLLEVNSN